MTSRSPVLRRVAYGVFRRLAPGVRRRAVRYLTPNYTVGAVVLVRDPMGQLLLLRQPPGAGWSLPGGLLNRGESPADGARRELQEESGIVAAARALRPAHPSARVSAITQQVDMVFTLDLPNPAPQLQLDPVEVLEAGWFPIDELPPLTTPTAQLLAAYGLGPRAQSGYDLADRHDPAAQPWQPGDQPSTAPHEPEGRP